jgi:hypothetical protein
MNGVFGCYVREATYSVINSSILVSREVHNVKIVVHAYYRRCVVTLCHRSPGVPYILVACDHIKEERDMILHCGPFNKW